MPASVQGFLFRGGLCLEVAVQEGLCPGGVSVQEVLCPKGPLSGRPPDRDPPYGKERAVHIFLECILVVYKFPRTCFGLIEETNVTTM